MLNRLDLSIQMPEIVSILGQSGSGKSNLLSLLAGLDHPDTGTVEVNGKNLCQAQPRPTEQVSFQEHLGIVFQQYHLMSNLTALENVRPPLGTSRDKRIQRACQVALKQVGLSNRLAHFPSQLSGGECQRVALARAIVSEPSLILADEPSGQPRSENRPHEIMDLLFRAVQGTRSRSLILVTHNRELAKQSDRTLILSDGRLNTAARRTQPSDHVIRLPKRMARNPEQSIILPVLYSQPCPRTGWFSHR